MNKLIYAGFTKISSSEERLVSGIASSETRDEAGETIRRSAIEAALPDYLRFSNIREMHAPMACGRAVAAKVDSRGLHITAKIVDEAAWQKVKERVYNGFSIGGKVTARDPKNNKVIIGLQLFEISLVDRPCNPEALFDSWKAAHLGDDGIIELLEKQAARLDSMQAQLTRIAREPLPPQTIAFSSPTLLRGRQ